MAAVTVSVVAKKVVEVLASSKKGRKFLLYTVGIVLFIVLLPLIAIVSGLLWWSNQSAKTFNQLWN